MPFKAIGHFRYKQDCPSPTLRVSQLIYKITNLWKLRLNRSLESGENNGKTHPWFPHNSPCHDMCLKKSAILAIENWYCFNFFSKSKAFHGLLFQEESFTITFCKPCKLLVNMSTFFFFSVPKVSNGFKTTLNILMSSWVPKLASLPKSLIVDGKVGIYIPLKTVWNVGKHEKRILSVRAHKRN